MHRLALEPAALFHGCWNSQRRGGAVCPSLLVWFCVLASGRRLAGGQLLGGCGRRSGASRCGGGRVVFCFFFSSVWDVARSAIVELCHNVYYRYQFRADSLINSDACLFPLPQNAIAETQIKQHKYL